MDEQTRPARRPSPPALAFSFEFAILMHERKRENLARAGGQRASGRAIEQVVCPSIAERHADLGRSSRRPVVRSVRSSMKRCNLPAEQRKEVRKEGGRHVKHEASQHCELASHSLFGTTCLDLFGGCDCGGNGRNGGGEKDDCEHISNAAKDAIAATAALPMLSFSYIMHDGVFYLPISPPLSLSLLLLISPFLLIYRRLHVLMLSSRVVVDDEKDGDENDEGDAVESCGGRAAREQDRFHALPSCLRSSAPPSSSLPGAFSLSPSLHRSGRAMICQ